MTRGMRSLVFVLALAAGCQQQPSRLDSMAGAAGGDLAARVDRLEKKLDKVIAALDQALPPTEPDPDRVYSVAVDPHDPVQGPADARVTIVEGFEFLCPYCYMVNPTVDQILAKYPRDVRLVSKYLVIHGEPAIAPGMMACAAAKQGKFKEMKAALWAHLFRNDSEGPQVQEDQLAPDRLRAIASEAGVDDGKLETDMTADDCTGWLKSSAESLKPVNVNATPAFFINGRYISGAQPLEAFEKVIDQEKAKADKAIAGGVAPADYYVREVVAKGDKHVKGRFED
jgi:protein-disulfide isomerase